MPTLKQINCCIEFGPDQIPLNEYGTTYSDGIVETFVAVPFENAEFAIRLTSSGYIAPGIAAFVFIEGRLQCNRNRCGLAIPSRGSSAEEYEVNLRLKQREDKLDNKRFIRKEWNFRDLNIVAADGAKSPSNGTSDGTGMIEVVVLRCQGESSSSSNGKSGKPHGSGNGPSSMKRNPTRARFIRTKDNELAFAIDGASDTQGNPNVYTRPIPEPYPSYTRPAPVPYHLANPYMPQWPPTWNGYPLFPPPHPSYPCPPYSSPMQPLHCEAPSAPSQPQQPLPPPHDFPYQYYGPGWYPIWPNALSTWPTVYHHAEHQNVDAGNANTGNHQVAVESVKNKKGKRKENKTEQRFKLDTGHDGANDWEYNPWDKAEGEKPGKDEKIKKGDKLDEKKNDTKQGWDVPWDANADAGVGAETNKWDTPDPKKDNDQLEKNSNNARSKHVSLKTGQENTGIYEQRVPQKEPVHHLYAKWRGNTSAEKKEKEEKTVSGTHKPEAQENKNAKATKTNPAPKTPTAKDKLYVHSTSTPTYIDTMSKPYAVFVFKYRSKDALEKILPETKIKESKGKYRDRMMALKKEEILEELMKAKKKCGYDTDSSMSTYSDDNDDNSDAKKDKDDKEKKTENKVNAKAVQELLDSWNNATSEWR